MPGRRDITWGGGGREKKKQRIYKFTNYPDVSTHFHMPKKKNSSQSFLNQRLLLPSSAHGTVRIPNTYTPFHPFSPFRNMLQAMEYSPKTLGQRGQEHESYIHSQESALTSNTPGMAFMVACS